MTEIRKVSRTREALRSSSISMRRWGIASGSIIRSPTIASAPARASARLSNLNDVKSGTGVTRLQALGVLLHLSQYLMRQNDRASPLCSTYFWGAASTDIFQKRYKLPLERLFVRGFQFLIGERGSA